MLSLYAGTVGVQTGSTSLKNQRSATSLQSVPFGGLAREQERFRERAFAAQFE